MRVPETLEEAVMRLGQCRCGKAFGEGTVGITDVDGLVMAPVCRECAVYLELAPGIVPDDLPSGVLIVGPLQLTM